jgi:hypothetical protein
LQRSLDSTGNLESTTQADYLATLKKPARSRQRRTIDFDTPKADSDRSHLVKRAAEYAAGTDDSALDAYFEAFPEQAEFRYVAQPDAAPKVRTCRCIRADMLSILRHLHLRRTSGSLTRTHPVSTTSSLQARLVSATSMCPAVVQTVPSCRLPLLSNVSGSFRGPVHLPVKLGELLPPEAKPCP